MAHDSVGPPIGRCERVDSRPLEGLGGYLFRGVDGALGEVVAGVAVGEPRGPL